MVSPEGHRCRPRRGMGHRVRRPRGRPHQPRERRRQDQDGALPDAGQRVAARRRGVSRLPRSARPRGPGRVRVSRLYLAQGSDDAHTLLVVHHGSRESIEFFEVGAGDGPPTLAWTGCAVAPEGARLNSVVALPGGGFATTNAGIGGVGVAGRQRLGGAARERGHRAERHRGVRRRRDPLHRRLGRGEADAPVARRRAGAEGRHRPRLPARQPPHGPSTARSSTPPATPTGTATPSPTPASRPWRRATSPPSTPGPSRSSASSCIPP